MPAIKRRTKTVRLPDEYEGFECEIWVNPPARLWTAVTSTETTEVEKIEALGQIVLSHNGWQDFDGNEYPAPNTPEFWEAIPTELAACVLALAQREMMQLPNSIAPRGRR